MNRAIAAVMLAIVLSGCDDVPPVAKYAVVYGRVFDSDSGRPLAGVTVTIDSVDTATTAGDGTYRIANVPTGPTDAAVDSPAGYALTDPSVLTFSVKPGDTFRLDLALKGS